MGKWKHRLSNIDAKSRIGDCSNCGVVKLAKNRDKFFRCRVAINEMKKSRGYYLHAPRPEGATCELCGGDNKIAYDHCHKTGNFRGWLCFRCNTTLGKVGDDPNLLRKMALYLENNQ